MQESSQRLPPQLITLTLPDNHLIQALGFKGQEIKKIAPDETSLSLTYPGGYLPQLEKGIELIVIPIVNTLRPVIIPIYGKAKNLTLKKDDLKFEQIKADEFILWGQGPKAVCSLHTPIKEAKAPLTFMLYPKPKPRSGSGAFIATFNYKTEFHFIHIDTPHGQIEEVNSPHFLPAEDSMKAGCQRYNGGPCHQIYRISTKIVGKSSELSLGPVTKNNIPCPI